MRTFAERPRPRPSSQSLKVPSSKELQRMRQFRQNQMFRQQQQMAKRLVDEQQKRDDGGEQKKHGGKGVDGDGMGVATGGGKVRVKDAAGSKRTAGSSGPGSSSSSSNASNASNALNASNSQKNARASTRTSSPSQSASSAWNSDGLTKEQWQQFAQSHGFESSWRAQVYILQTLGLTPLQLTKIAHARVEIFNTSAKTLTRKIAFFRDVVSMSDADIVKLICKSPRVLEYGSEQTVRPRIAFLEQQCGVPAQVITKVLLKSPMIMSLSLKETLEPRVAFLREHRHLNLNKSQLGKLISRHPQVLTCTEESMQQRVDFLVNKAGVGGPELSKVVVAHPQVLHYKLDSMLERLTYLRSVGMQEGDIAQAVARFPQIFSLSVTTNMAPKWHYLVEHLGGDVKALCSYPGYFSLSLSNRIQMRHLYLGQVLEGGAPMPFPLSYLKMSDEKFAVEIAGETVEGYERFKKAMSVTDGLLSLSEFEESGDEEERAPERGSNDSETSLSVSSPPAGNVLKRVPNATPFPMSQATMRITPVQQESNQHPSHKGIRPNE